ncbi:M56 family metallopeptidase [Dyadobacter psychrotolerans]|uniref:Peptidase M56 BlaR1 n=1 Tax=Dyadobacter psychrotolerans TaxID=2541721 RepID=A0A4R5DX37_9BACT|nr:M56 family metallopeptidase [Dyadobacter psychrotolerans]TDE16731.1 peptidase M56 BlaR1 [Dyadobacter psychrotolerans]
MSPFIEYLLKITIGFAVVSCFYQFVLRKYTFYNWNRWYLLLYSALVFFIPFINVDQTLKQVELVDHQIVQFVPAVQHYTRPAVNFAVNEAVATEVNRWDVLVLMFGTGVVFMFVRSMLFFVSFRKIRKKAKLISGDGVKIYEVQKDIIPFSFGNSIFINRNLHDEDELREIMLHEFVHVKQRHTLDIIFAEILCILNWYNPFVWQIRYAIRQNLEFIADRQVLENGVDVKQYQYLLLKVTGVPAFRIANQFNFSSLKQRIIMMNKMKSARIQLIRFLFVLPLLFVLLVAFRQDVENQINVQGKEYVKDDQTIYISGLVLEVLTGKPISNLPLEIKLGDRKTTKPISTDSDGFYYLKFDAGDYSSDSVFNYQVMYNDGAEQVALAGYNTLFFNGKAVGRPYGLIKNRGSDIDGGEHFTISFLRKVDKLLYAGRPYGIYQEEFFKSNRSSDVKNELRSFLQEESKAPVKEQNLIANFKKEYKRPRHVITKFENGFFTKDQKLVGYEGNLQFYLDGKPATYYELNAPGKGSPPTLLNTDFKHDDRRLATKMFYYTYPTNKEAPPASYLKKDNVEWIDVASFDISKLDSEPFFLDGFRQVFGVGSNIKPLKEEIKRIAVFKGKLARYYDKKLDRLWWIETRPVDEVYGRPALANN